MNVLKIRHVLCPMDLSPISMNALEWANAIARARRAELRMLHVVAPEGIIPAEGLGFGERDDMITRLRGALTSIDAATPLAGAAHQGRGSGRRDSPLRTITVCAPDRHGRDGRRTTRASGRIGHDGRGGPFRLSSPDCAGWTAREVAEGRSVRPDRMRGGCGAVVRSV